MTPPGKRRVHQTFPSVMEPRAAEPYGMRAVAALLYLLVGTPGCAVPPETSSGIEIVYRRLDAASFPPGPAPRHGPIAQIGDEARTVVRAPREILIAEAFGVVPEKNLANIEIELPAQARDLPQSAFQLAVQTLPYTPALLDHKSLANIARKNFSLRRQRGWSIRRLEGDSRAVLQIEQPDDERVILNLRLTALEPVPRSLESEAFDTPANARLRIGFGLTPPRDRRETLSVEFVATLSCTGDRPRVLVRQTLSLRSPKDYGWHDVEVPLGGAALNCRLSLENRVAGGQPPRGAVWAAPQILTTVPRGANTNLILISLDTLRADHLSGQGYPRQTSPVIDRELMARGTTFTDVSSTFPQTDISHLSIFTGLYPSAQPERGRVSADNRLVLLAELLQSGGFQTAAFTENALVSGAFGFWFGFDQFTERSFAHSERGEATFEDGIRYLEAHRDQRFFLFLHTYKTHDPYAPSPEYDELWNSDDTWSQGGPAPWVPENHRDALDRYDRTIREADTLVGRLLKSLADLDLAERTVVILTSDHGEAFGEHGIGGHGFTPHREALEVPLILRGPGIPANRKIDTPVSIVDITPTILDLVGLAIPRQSQGTSLRAAWEGGGIAENRPLFFSWLRPGALGVRYKTMKYHRTDEGHETFDVAVDPQEWKPNRDSTARQRGDSLLRAHQEESNQRRVELGPTSSQKAPAKLPTIDERTKKSLEALGYL